MLNTRVGGISLVVVTDRLACMREKNSMLVVAPRLHTANGEVLFGDDIRYAGALGLVGGGARPRIIGVDFLPQHRALEGTAGFSLLVFGQADGENSIG